MVLTEDQVNELLIRDFSKNPLNYRFLNTDGSIYFERQILKINKHRDNCSIDVRTPLSMDDIFFYANYALFTILEDENVLVYDYYYFIRLNQVKKIVDLPGVVSIDSGSENYENEDCAICLEKMGDYVDNPLKKINSCGHVFHGKCLKTLFNHNKKALCPLCRGGVNTN